MSKRNKANPAEKYIGKIGGEIGALVDDVMSSIGATLDMIGVAEDEIRAAQRRWPNQKDVLFHSFSLVRPERGVDIHEQLYRSYVRELLDRIGSGKGDTRDGTTAEVLLGLKEASLRAPLSHEGFALYLRMWEEAGMPPLWDEGEVNRGELYEALSRQRIDEDEQRARRAVRMDTRRLDLSEIRCEGLHHGEPVACKFAADTVEGGAA